ncbi:MAG: hypothetical protein Q8M65_01015, partial [Rhodoglobus sp.]|nr:hypothetical protein [Rhodoglobus sp.]
ASESLKVIAYFDALVEGRASLEVLLRGSAVLSGCASGFATDLSATGVNSQGTRITLASGPPEGQWPEHAVPGGGRAWLERDGALHANDEMILERLAIAIGIMLERSAPQAAMRKAVETVIDPSEPSEGRRLAAARLRLDPAGRFVVVAEPVGACTPVGHHTVVVTPVGPVRARIQHLDEDAAAGDRAGVGYAVSPDRLDRSWLSALTALRLTSASQMVLRADDLGGVILLAEAMSAQGYDHPDLAALRRQFDAGPRMVSMVEAIVATDSLRAAAVAAGLHHSTMQAHANDVSSSLGFDVRTAAGRTRLSIALSLYRLATNTFS